MLTLSLAAALVAVPALAQDPGTAIVEIQRDTRRCMAPLCGGWWVRAVNLPKTMCADGTKANWCYVADLDYTPVPIPPDEQLALELAASEREALLQVSFTPFEFDGIPLVNGTVTRGWIDAAR